MLQVTSIRHQGLLHFGGVVDVEWSVVCGYNTTRLQWFIIIFIIIIYQWMEAMEEWRCIPCSSTNSKYTTKSVWSSSTSSSTIHRRAAVVVEWWPRRRGRNNRNVALQLSPADRSLIQISSLHIPILPFTYNRLCISLLKRSDAPC